MKDSKEDLIKYRLLRARDTLDDAQILAEKNKWNSTINRLYYEYFIATNKIPKELGKIYSQLFTWRQKGDYDDLFDFRKEKVIPYFEPVKRLIDAIENILDHGSSVPDKQ